MRRARLPNTRCLVPVTLPIVLIRLFRGVIRADGRDRLLRVLHDDVLPGLASHPDITYTSLALSWESSPNEYLLETHWRSTEALARYCPDWRTPRLEPSEEEDVVSVSAHHYLTDWSAPGSVVSPRSLRPV